MARSSFSLGLLFALAIACGGVIAMDGDGAATDAALHDAEAEVVGDSPGAGEAGGAQTITLATLQTGPAFALDIAVDTKNDATSVMKCPLSGCGGNPTVLASPGCPQAMTIDSTSVYWADGTPYAIKACDGRIVKRTPK